MSFHSGRVTFCRFRCSGSAPQTVDEGLLTALGEHAFRESGIGAPGEVEAGWTTGEHIFDTEFAYEKNGYGTGLLFALRLDTNKVPGEVKRAYQKINEQTAAAGNPSGFASKLQKRDAADDAARQIHADLAAGRFRRSKSIPVLWDLSSRVVYCGATGNTILEQMGRLFHETFSLDLEYLSSGVLAGEALARAKRTRDYEDLMPSPFTDPPPQAGPDYEDADGPGDVTIPLVPWVAKSVDQKDFLGNEFAIWLWWLTETASGAVHVTDPGGREFEAVLAIDKTLDMDCAWEVRGKQTLRGDGPTRLNEAREALATGKWPRKIGMVLSDGEHQWDLTLQTDRMIVSAATLPDLPDAQGPRDVVEGRLQLIGALARTLDSMYARFLTDRTAGGWATTRQKIREWIKTRRRR